MHSPDGRQHAMLAVSIYQKRDCSSSGSCASFVRNVFFVLYGATYKCVIHAQGFVALACDRNALMLEQSVSVNIPQGG